MNQAPNLRVYSKSRSSPVINKSHSSRKMYSGILNSIKAPSKPILAPIISVLWTPLSTSLKTRNSRRLKIIHLRIRISSQISQILVRARLSQHLPLISVSTKFSLLKLRPIISIGVSRKKNLVTRRAT